MTRPTRAFTLIELLIVVAIIAILAAIAIPNFLEAQTRSKVARVRSDLRTLATGLEAYAVDHNRSPFDGAPGSPHYGWATALNPLTTPVAYLTTLFADVFQDSTMAEATLPGHTNYIGSSHSYDYGTAYWEEVATDTAKREVWMRNMGNSAWKLTSAGPDRAFDNDGSFYGLRELYDPTNGTVSDGDLVRSQARMQ